MSDDESGSSNMESSDRKNRLEQLIDKAVECEKTLNERSTMESLGIMTDIIQETNEVSVEDNVEECVDKIKAINMKLQIVQSGQKVVKTLIRNDVSEFNDEKYAAAILKIVKEDGSGWDKIAQMACKIARTVRVKSSMLGAIDPNPRSTVSAEPQKPQKRQKRKKVESVEEVPENLTHMRREDKGAEKVNIVSKQIANYMRENNVDFIPFYKLIIDPKNFMKTVDNALQLSHLVKEHAILICKGKDGYPEVRLIKPDDNLINFQNICSLNMALVEKFIEIYDIKEPILNISAETN